MNTAAVTIGTHQVTVTPTNGTATTINLTTTTRIDINSRNPMPLDNTAMGPGFPYGTTLPNFYPSIKQWVVELVENDRVLLSLPMGNITNQGSWVNTAAGAEIARAAIAAQIP